MRKSTAAVGITGATIVAAIAYFVVGLFGPGRGPGGGESGSQKGGPGGKAGGKKGDVAVVETRKNMTTSPASAGATPQRVTVSIKDHQYLVNGEERTLDEVVDLANRMIAEHGGKATIDIVQEREARITAINNLDKRLGELEAENKLRVFRREDASAS